MHGGPQIAASWGEFVEVAAGVAGVGPPVEDPVVDQAGEAVGEHCLGDVEVSAEVAEVAYTVEGVADDQQCPALADTAGRCTAYR